METEEKQQAAEQKAPLSVRLFRALLIAAGLALLAYFVSGSITNPDTKYPFKYGLDLAGGTHLVYTADTSSVDTKEIPALMNVLRDVIERRVNMFGAQEPQVYTERSALPGHDIQHRLVVELPGVTDVAAAVKEIGETPVLEFKLLDPEAAEMQLSGAVNEDGTLELSQSNDALLDEMYIDTGLTGRYVRGAELTFGGASTGIANEPVVIVNFDGEGTKLFKELTTDNVGKQLAIFLDGEQISAPVINEPIPGGSAVISGSFTLESAKALVDDLNFGALPMPVELETTQLIDADLGAKVLDKGITAGTYGLAAIAAFMLLWYRGGGVAAVLGLSAYLLIMLALFVTLPVTLTAAGIAGFIISLGMAVDANVLVFERVKEEYRDGAPAHEALRAGFKRALPAIRDGNITSLLAALVLYIFATSFVKGFAFVLMLGILVSMFSALIVTRVFAHLLPDGAKKDGGIGAFLISSGFKR